MSLARLTVSGMWNCGVLRLLLKVTLLSTMKARLRITYYISDFLLTSLNSRQWCLNLPAHICVIAGTDRSIVCFLVNATKAPSYVAKLSTCRLCSKWNLKRSHIQSCHYVYGLSAMGVNGFFLLATRMIHCEIGYSFSEGVCVFASCFVDSIEKNPFRVCNGKAKTRVQVQQIDSLNVIQFKKTKRR
jgi:hypothetical protein